ncbi:MAG: ABC transporter substrate-binding protein [Oscillospiraceae bacterium]|nr:ABC transporter substrate-binding protein [Oscillospiraceae bacterium]
MVKNKLLCVLPLILVLFLVSCSESEKISDNPYETEGLVFSERAALSYADQFAIDRYEDGYSMISVADGSRYLIVPEGKSAPEKLDRGIKIIKRPAENIYLAATSAMGIFEALDCGNSVRFSGTKAEDWYIDYARNAMEKGSMLYAGKYREPDYELLVSENCGLSVQSTMIEHTPEVKEKLEELGITVFVDYSSYESHPLGRSEWIKVYGEITGNSDEAESIFTEQTQQLDDYESTGKTAVFFYISNSGQAVTRKPGDYVTKMIEIAGGENIFKDLGSENASSAVTMEMEKFYKTAKDADFIIYNSTIGGEINSLDELISKNKLLADFKAVKDGNVWCTRNNLFQETMKLSAVISDFNKIFTGKYTENPPQFLYKLESGDSGQ